MERHDFESLNAVLETALRENGVAHAQHAAAEQAAQETRTEGQKNAHKKHQDEQQAAQEGEAAAIQRQRSNKQAADNLLAQVQQHLEQSRTAIERAKVPVLEPIPAAPAKQDLTPSAGLQKALEDVGDGHQKLEARLGKYERFREFAQTRTTVMIVGAALGAMVLFVFIGALVNTNHQNQVAAEATENANATATGVAYANATATENANATATKVIAVVESGVHVVRNHDWVPFSKTFDAVTMVLVPAGCFMMGSDSGESDEKPVHEVCFDQPFWIDQTEVTQAQFKNLGGRAEKASSFTGDNRPVEQITWFEARDFCAQRNARLPTEAEWEYAARGPDGLSYPWGNTFVADNAVYSGNSNSQTANVGSHPGGVSWVGALDMSGNVREWMSSLYKPYPHKPDDGRESTSDTNSSRVLRGGSWWGINGNLRAANRGWGTPDYWNDFDGFRCARSYK